jgi:hypothetical protein
MKLRPTCSGLGGDEVASSGLVLLIVEVLNAPTVSTRAMRCLIMPRGALLRRELPLLAHEHEAREQIGLKLWASCERRETVVCSRKGRRATEKAAEGIRVAAIDDAYCN